MPRLFHVSDDPGIRCFEPRPSPSFFEAIRGDVVFGIEEALLHHYLLPRDCPRVGFYAGEGTSAEDAERFLGAGDIGLVRPWGAMGAAGSGPGSDGSMDVVGSGREATESGIGADLRVGHQQEPSESRFGADREAGRRARYVMAIEERWLPAIKAGTIYVYELPVEGFTLLDECAGYYVSYEAVAPLSMRPVTDIMGELMKRPIELRVMGSLWPLAEAVKQSTLQFSCIRMRNALND